MPKPKTPGYVLGMRSGSARFLEKADFKNRVPVTQAFKIIPYLLAFLQVFFSHLRRAITLLR